MTNFWVPDITEQRPITWSLVEVAHRTKAAYAVCPPFEVHVRLEVKHEPATLAGVDRDRILVRLADGSWREVWFGDIAEAQRFTRTVKRFVKVLAGLARETARAWASRARVDRRAQDRKGREGTCPACEGTFIAKQTKLVLHGYCRPGTGEVIGKCFGVGHVQTEVSDSGIRAFLGYLDMVHTRVLGSLSALPNRDEITVFPRWRGDKSRTFKRGDAGFDRAKEDIQHRLESELRLNEFDRDRTKHRLETWKPVP